MVNVVMMWCIWQARDRENWANMILGDYALCNGLDGVVMVKEHLRKSACQQISRALKEDF